MAKSFYYYLCGSCHPLLALLSLVRGASAVLTSLLSGECMCNDYYCGPEQNKNMSGCFVFSAYWNATRQPNIDTGKGEGREEGLKRKTDNNDEQPVFSCERKGAEVEIFCCCMIEEVRNYCSSRTTSFTQHTRQIR